MREIGRYQIHEKVGAGGMAEVYRAVDTQLERDVAIKVMSVSFQSKDEFVTRFEREARIVARLEHPHIVRLYDYGIDESHEQPYLVMQLVSSGTLLDRLESITIDETFLLVDQMCSALEVAHLSGIVHRDIKPSNILYDEHGNAYLTDFGIARHENSATELTGNRFVGTPFYMSPEQCRPKMKITPMSDQYSLAVVIFHLLAKAPMFEGETLQIMYQHIHEPPPLSKLIERQVPIRVIQALRIALDKNPDNRYPSIREFRDALIHGGYKDGYPAAGSADNSGGTASGTRRSSPSRPSQAPRPSPQRYSPLPRKQTPPPQSKSKANSNLRSNSKAKPPLEGSTLIDQDATIPDLKPISGAQRHPQPVRTERSSSRSRTARISPPPSTQDRPSSSSTIPTQPNAGPNRTRAYLIGGALFLLIASVASFFLFRGDNRTTVVSSEPTGSAINVQLEQTEPAVAAEREAAEATPVPLPNGIELFPEALETEFNGEMLMLTSMEETLLVASEGPPFTVSNPFGATGQLAGSGLMGVVYSKESNELIVHCLEGSCEVKGDIAGTESLRSGEKSRVGPSGAPSPAEPAEYDRFVVMSGMVSTPTTTPAAAVEAVESEDTATPLPEPIERLMAGITFYPETTVADIGADGQTITLGFEDTVMIVSSETVSATVRNQRSARAELLSPGTLGVVYQQASGRYEVYCLDGQCNVKGDIEGELPLKTGEAALVGASGVPTPLEVSVDRYDIFADFYDVSQFIVATATPTATTTSTPTNPPPPPTATPVRPAATSVPVQAPTAVPVVPTQVNPLDPDGDGVLHDPSNNLYDLCQDAPGNPGTCGCPADRIPAQCGGGGSPPGDGPTATPGALP